MAFYGMTVNFIIQKSVFSGDRFFWGNERKYFTHIPGPTPCWFLFSKLCHWGHPNLQPDSHGIQEGEMFSYCKGCTKRHQWLQLQVQNFGLPEQPVANFLSHFEAYWHSYQVHDPLQWLQFHRHRYLLAHTFNRNHLRFEFQLPNSKLITAFVTDHRLL